MAASRAPSLHARSRAAPACLGQGLWSLLRGRRAGGEREGFGCGCKAGECQSPAVEPPAPLHLCTKGWQPVAPAAMSAWGQRLSSVMGRGRGIKLQKKLVSKISFIQGDRTNSFRSFSWAARRSHSIPRTVSRDVLLVLPAQGRHCRWAGHPEIRCALTSWVKAPLASSHTLAFSRPFSGWQMQAMFSTSAARPTWEHLQRAGRAWHRYWHQRTGWGHPRI